MLSDSALIAAARRGSRGAVEILYERHREAALRFARQFASSSMDADDLVSEAFAAVLEAMRNGGGPEVAFRAYLLRAVRNVAYQRFRRDGRVQLRDEFPDLPSADRRFDPDSAVAASAERRLVTEAFAALPERWQAVLWYTEVERMPPVQVAPLLGLSANGVAALAYRAREGMRQAYLQAHLAGTTADRCRATIDRLGAWTRERLSRRETAQVEAHLDRCADCRALAAELAEVNGALRAVLAPLLLGPAALGYLTSGGTTAAAPGTAAASGFSGSAGQFTQQAAGVAAAAAALVAAVLVGLTAQGGESPPPVAAGSPPPVRQEVPTERPSEPTVLPTVPSVTPPASPAPAAPTTSPTTPALPPTPAAGADPPAAQPESLNLAARYTPLASGHPQPVGRLDLTLGNAVRSSRPATITVTLPPGTVVRQSEPSCHGSDPRTVSCSVTIQPGRPTTVTLTLGGRPERSSSGTATATAGALSTSVAFPLQTESPPGGSGRDGR